MGTCCLAADAIERHTSYMLYLSEDFTSTAGAKTAREQVYQIMPDAQGRFQANLSVLHANDTLTPHDSNPSIVTTAIACCVCACLSEFHWNN